MSAQTILEVDLPGSPLCPCTCSDRLYTQGAVRLQKIVVCNEVCCILQWKCELAAFCFRARSAGIFLFFYFLQNVLWMYVNNLGRFASCRDLQHLYGSVCTARLDVWQLSDTEIFRVKRVTSQVTYRVIQVSDGQLEGQTDGAAAVSLVAGFPATTQAVTQVQLLLLT